MVGNNMSKPCLLFVKTICNDQIHSKSFLMYDSSSNSDKLDEISYLEMYPPVSKITWVVLYFSIIFGNATSVHCSIDFL